MKCQNCGNEIQNNNAKFCPKCGTKVEQIPVVHAPTKSTFSHDISAIWPEWQIEKQIGRGSYGVVYQAIRKDNNVESHAAIKIISIPSDASEVDSLRSEGLDMDGTRTYFKGIVDDFVSEIQLMESLKGIQNIVSVEDYKVVEKTDAIGWDIYIRMELLTSFNSYICDKTLTEAEIIKLGKDICTALEICNQRNIIHRDIKPENIFVNDFGYFKLGDFGIARKLENVTGGLSQKGTYNYMAPEVANSNDYDTRVDTYSLGIVLYRLLNNNKLPFLDTDKQLLNPNERKNAVDRRIRGEELPAPCNASPAMANLILRACAYDPNTRFASATEMKQALINVENGTYQIDGNDLDKTTSVRSAQTDYDATTAVRKASENKGQDAGPVVNTFGDVPKKNKGKKAKIIAISVLTGIVALAIALVAVFFTSPAYSVYTNMQDKDYDKALADYRLDVEADFIQELILDMTLKNHADEVVTQYNNGEMDFNTSKRALNALQEMDFEGIPEKLDGIMASHADQVVAQYNNGESDFDATRNELNALQQMGFAGASEKLDAIMTSYANDTVAKYNSGDLDYTAATSILEHLRDCGYEQATTLIDTVTVSKNSDVALEKGNQYYEDGEYENAITELSKIPEDNENYAEAQTKLDQVYADYINATVATATSYNASGAYKEAINQVNTAYNVLPDNVDKSALDTAKEQSMTAYKTQIANEVTELTNESKYTNAFDVIDEAIAFDDNAYFQNLKTSTEDNYVKSVTATVQGHLNNEDYISAARVAESALKVLPDNAGLKALKTRVDDETPTYFLDVCKPYEKGTYTEFINGEKIKMGGKEYTNGFTLIDGGDGYAIFNIGGNYTMLSFVLGHCDGTDMTNSTVKIYCDGILETTIPVNWDALPQKNTIDITGVKQIKFEFLEAEDTPFAGFGNVTIK